MNLRYRKTIIAGNWKMHKTPDEARDFITELRPLATQAKWCEVVLCVPFIDIPAAAKAAKGSRIAIAAQNCHYAEDGAFTGEISCQMLAACGVKYVLIGHSERREYYNETDSAINKKIHAALACGLSPILCVGESEMMRDCNVTMEHIRLQVKTALQGVTAQQMKHVTIAYEPIWAIGTGKTAASAQAGEVGSAIRDCLRQLYGARVARSVSLLYGGSMRPGNAAELLAQTDVDGGLIGGASLHIFDFSAIIEAAMPTAVAAPVTEEAK